MFNQFNLNERLLKALTKLAFTKPTAVQQQAIPLAMQGKDLFITAPTGTGKTLAFTLPLLHRLLANGCPGDGLQALIILPTRELATQIYKALQQVASYTFFKPLLVTGGEELKEQAAKLRKNPDIVIGTPGRLIEHWKNKQLALDQLQILVLDEADRILDMGFDDDVNTLIDHCPTTRQTLLFSATQGDHKLQALIKNLLKDPISIQLTPPNKANSNISQQVILTDNTAHKVRLVEWLLAHETYRQTIIFANTRAQVDQLSNTLTATQIKHAVLHSDKTAQERKQTIIRLHQQHITILIATDVAARGLDIKEIDLIINFDLPNTSDEYIHRIGRTGRMDNKGLAISLVTPADWKKLKRIEDDSQQPLIKRTVDKLPASFQGFINNNPKTTKTTNNTKTPTNKPTKPKTSRTPSKVISADGFAPLKRKK